MTANDFDTTRLSGVLAIGLLAAGVLAGTADLAFAGCRSAVRMAQGLQPATARRVTLAVARTDRGRLISSSEGTFRSSAPSNACVRSGDVFVCGKPGVHAEVKIVGAAEKLGVRVDAISASHRICKDCQAALRTHNPNIKYQSALR